MKIAVIVPYYPDYRTIDLFQRCKDSISPQFILKTVVDHDAAGVSVARNWGLVEVLNNSDVDYVTFLDADDTFNDNAFEQMCEAINECPEAEIIQLNHERKKKGYDKWMKHFNSAGWYGLDNLPAFWVAVWNKIFKVDLIQNIRFIEGLNYGEDEMFNLECLAKARRIYCSERIAMTHHFDNPNSLTRTVDVHGLIDEQCSLMELLCKYKGDKELYEVIRQRQVELWSSAVYKTIKGE